MLSNHDPNVEKTADAIRLYMSAKLSGEPEWTKPEAVAVARALYPAYANLCRTIDTLAVRHRIKPAFDEAPQHPIVAAITSAFAGTPFTVLGIKITPVDPNSDRHC